EFVFNRPSAVKDIRIFIDVFPFRGEGRGKVLSVVFVVRLSQAHGGLPGGFFVRRALWSRRRLGGRGLGGRRGLFLRRRLLARFLLSERRLAGGRFGPIVGDDKTDGGDCREDRPRK